MLNSFRRANQIISSLWDSKLIVSILALPLLSIVSELPCPARSSVMFSLFYLEGGNLGVTGTFLITIV